MYVRCMHACIYVCMLDGWMYVCMNLPVRCTPALQHRRSYLFLRQ